MSEKTIDSEANVSGTSHKTIDAQAFIIQVRSIEITSSAVIITGEPNVRLFMVE
jgi:hypothetical protein